MSTKLIVPSTLVLALLGACAAHAQDLPPTQSVIDTTRVPAPAPGEAVGSGGGMDPKTGGGTNRDPAGKLSQWITYTPPDCCGPIGDNGPIQTELFLRSGWSYPINGGVFGHTLKNGWDIAGGGRTLFFNPERDAAWTVGLSVSNIHYDGQHEDVLLPFDFVTGTAPLLTTVTSDVSVHGLNMTFFNVELGREWYLTGAANSPCNRWRAGFDWGGRLGSAKVLLHDRGPTGTDFFGGFHRTDVVYGVYAAIHTDYEIPCGGCCTFLIGLRGEWDYNWMDILQSRNDSNMQELNFLITTGVRF
jgi:hypothetical protein